MRWFPWRYVVRRVARAHGFLDPVSLLSQMHRFAQPSEVGEPIELLRAGVVFHARGLMNTKAIQHNLDWSWPFWVERQFDPNDDAFIPRAFSITHVNLTHRNWTAVGLPDLDSLPIVDPRGLLTPFWDGWSLDAWIVRRDGTSFLPSRAAVATQTLDMSNGIAVVTETRTDDFALSARVLVDLEGPLPECRLRVRAASRMGGWAVVALRPANPEGVSFVHDVALEDSGRSWRVNERHRIRFQETPSRHRFSDYRSGDVLVSLRDEDQRDAIRCDVGLATAAALFDLEPGAPREVLVSIPLDTEAESQKPRKPLAPGTRLPTWDEALRDTCSLEVPDARVKFLWDAAIRTLVLHSPGEVYPGPYTYKRFWFRDAAFIIDALLCTGMVDRAWRALERFPAQQTHAGYFKSQEGEWDSNGEALWILERGCALTGRRPPDAWRRAAEIGAVWITKKRLPMTPRSPHAGLLPPGFSAEHLGTNDYYYWDDFWGVAGLRSAASLLARFGQRPDPDPLREESEAFLRATEASIATCVPRLVRSAVPAAPYRRLDAGAIGSIVAGYPLRIWPARDQRLLDTVEFLLDECTFAGGFFQDMIHSGINAYLTLHLAQVLLRAGDPRFTKLLMTVADLATSTGQWPEAIHPRTRGGCMGDGQHAWAAAEWALAVRNAFVREEGRALVIGSGLAADWLAEGAQLSIGPAPTEFGTIRLQLRVEGPVLRASWSWSDAAGRARPERIELRVPGFAHQDTTAEEAVLERVTP